MADDLTPEIGDTVEYETDDRHGYGVRGHGEIVTVFKNGNIKVRDGDDTYRVPAADYLILAKA